MDPQVILEGFRTAHYTPYANSTLLAALLFSLATQKHTPRVRDQFDDEYDYIVVGAGAGGSVVARRLSEIECASVLLLEAGPQPPLLTDLPGIAQQFTDSEFDWLYLTEPQEHTAHAFKNNQVKYPRGKMLGGSTAFNTLQYVRGNHKNYDEWAEGGATGWSFEEILPYFMKAENNQDEEYYRNGYHGREGPMTVSEMRYETEIKQPLVKAFEDLGYDVVDPNGPQQTGIYKAQAFYRKGQRCSAAKGYLVPVDDRKNLDIVSQAHVTQVVISDGRALGVIVVHKNTTVRFVEARREVILSAGSLNTPQILMLSGIGPEEELNRLGIPVVANLPVGKFLQDHCATFQAFELSEHIEPFDKKLINNRYIREYIGFRTGPLASTGGRVIENFVNDKFPNKYPDFPPLEIFLTESSASACKKGYNLRDDVFKEVFEPYDNKPFYLCQPQPLQPKSRGYVRLQSRNPFDKPLCNPNYLAEEEDFEHLIQGMKICHAIGTSKPMQRVGSRPFTTVYPGCRHVAGDLDAYLRCVARMTCSTFYHPVGTVRMGRVDDPDTVLDPQLRVKHVRGLRVADASVMPKITSGNTEAPTIMIAEKASDMIKADHGRCP